MPEYEKNENKIWWLAIRFKCADGQWPRDEDKLTRLQARLYITDIVELIDKISKLYQNNV